MSKKNDIHVYEIVVAALVVIIYHSILLSHLLLTVAMLYELQERLPCNIVSSSEACPQLPALSDNDDAYPNGIILEIKPSVDSGLASPSCPLEHGIVRQCERLPLAVL